MQRKVPLALKVIRISFRSLQFIWPSRADKWAVELFLTPRRGPYTEAGKALLSKVETFEFEAGGKRLVGYQMGSGPEVICMHGWAGKATQFAAIADRLVKAGYSFIAFDAWAHGQSKGKQASMFDFTDGFNAILKRCKNPAAVIAHSLGAASISFAVSQGTDIPKFISMGAPAVAEDILDSFREIIQAKPRINKAIRDACLERFDREFDHVTMQHTFSSISAPILAVHGEEDFDVGIHHLDVLESINPEIRSIRATGLGHRRILKDEKIMDQIIEFIA